ncbi:MAG: hypothetical protein M1832_005022 [Thelocarpon impressellum]|nr:MAG: hypothetical protein M1832_005022 [Thelocarpon impressellum]
MPTTDPLAKIIDDLTAVSKFLTHRAVNRNAQDSGIRQARTRSRLFLTFLKQLRELALSNNAAQKIAHARNKFSDPINLKQWIREEMQERWEAKHGSPTFAALRTQLKIRADSAKAAGNEREQRAVAREKRHLMKTIFTECVQEELREIWDDLQGELLYPLRDLGVLHSLRNGQNFILMRDRCTTLELVEELDRSSGQTQDLVGKDSHFLKSQLDALLSLMAIGLRTAAALETRLNRLSAKDVRDRDEREAVKQRRLSQPEALLYLSKASEDLQFIRDYSQTVVAGFGNVESEMGRLADAAIDTLAAGERCAIALEGQKRKVTV